MFRKFKEHQGYSSTLGIVGASEVHVLLLKDYFKVLQQKPVFEPLDTASMTEDQLRKARHKMWKRDYPWNQQRSGLHGKLIWGHVPRFLINFVELAAERAPQYRSSIFSSQVALGFFGINLREAVELQQAFKLEEEREPNQGELDYGTLVTSFQNRLKMIALQTNLRVDLGLKQFETCRRNGWLKVWEEAERVSEAGLSNSHISDLLLGFVPEATRQPLFNYLRGGGAVISPTEMIYHRIRPSLSEMIQLMDKYQLQDYESWLIPGRSVSAVVPDLGPVKIEG